MILFNVLLTSPLVEAMVQLGYKFQDIPDWPGNLVEKIRMKHISTNRYNIQRAQKKIPEPKKQASSMLFA